jgi:hypothetical protein
MKLRAYGQNIIIDPIKQYDETWVGRVELSPWKNKMSVGTIVFYPDRHIKIFNVPNGDGVKTFHSIWEPQIMAISIDEEEVNRIANDLPDLSLTKEQLKNDTYKGRKLK